MNPDELVFVGGLVSTYVSGLCKAQMNPEICYKLASNQNGPDELVFVGGLVSTYVSGLRKAQMNPEI